MSSDLPAAIPTVGSALQLTPATGRVSFVDEDERWDLPLIGWAVVVSRVVADRVDEVAPTYETAIEPLVLDNEDSVASTVRD